MSKKNKLIVLFITGFIFITAFSISFTTFIYHYIEASFYDKASQLIATATQNAPQMEQELVASLKNCNPNKISEGKEILAQYGYEQKYLGTFNNEAYFYKLIWITILLIILLFVGLLTLLLWLNDKNRNRITGLTKYLYNINEGNYILKSESYEDEFSILEDELYKTVVMLKETRETAKFEKSNLAANLADISHQIKTPLTSMSMMVELMEESKNDSEDRLYLERISAQIDRLNQLVGALLNISKLDAGTLILDKTMVNVYEMLSSAIEPLSLTLEKKEITFSLQEDSDVMFKGNFYWSSEAILNIVKNCIEHTPQRGNIVICYEQNPIYTKIIIEDDGEGFSNEDIPYIFTRFYKGKNASKDSVGIGLALSKSIIDRQNGEIRAENKKTGGARFIIKFFA
jgi:signal transduction histidine kinase